MGDCCESVKSVKLTSVQWRQCWSIPRQEWQMTHREVKMIFPQGQTRWVTLVGEKRQLIKHYQGNLSGSIKSTSEPDYQLHYVTTTWWGAQTWAGPYCIYTDMMRRWQTSVSAGQRGNTYAAWRAQGRASPVSTWGRRKDETGETEGEKKPWTVTM